MLFSGVPAVEEGKCFGGRSVIPANALALEKLEAVNGFSTYKYFTDMPLQVTTLQPSIFNNPTISFLIPKWPSLNSTFQTLLATESPLP